jgi:acetoacetyl-CoA synthetase
MAAPRILWQPSSERMQRATITRYVEWLRERGVHTDGYDALWRWSVDEPAAFWSSIWDFCDIRAAHPFEHALSHPSMPGTKWFEGSRLNYAEHAFRGKSPDAVALLAAGEVRGLEEWTWERLRDETARIAHGLRALGVGAGDRVVAYMPNIPETVAALFATASLGAVWSSCSPEFGVMGVVDRFRQIEPTVLLTIDGYRHQGQDHDRRELVERLRSEMPSLEHTVLLPYLDPEARLEGTLGWDELTAAAGELVFAEVPFDHPLWVLYSSGTTGLPKAIVHGHGGILLEHLKVLRLHLDAQPDDRVFWFTTTSWMMWNFLVGCLLTDATIVLYDGSAKHPDLGVLWDLAAETGTTCFGTSPTFLGECLKRDLRPLDGRDLGALRSIGSTGSPLPPETFDWVYDHFDPDLWLFSTSGGTDLCTAFVGGCPVLPVYRGELQCRALGANVQAFDDEGRPVVGSLGELVLTTPLPSMPLFFWNDKGDERYRESYFSTYPGVWRHGDWIEITDRGTAVIYGRSDATINRGGIRMGSSELYRVLLTIPEIEDALVVDVDGWLPLFVVLADGAVLDEALTLEIKRRLSEDCSPRHVPGAVYSLAAVPRTHSGKVLEVPVKRILLGVPADIAVSREAVANPSALDPFIELARERRAESAPS